MLALLLVLGFVLNYFVKPLDNKHFMTESELAKEKEVAAKKDAANKLIGKGGNSNSALQKIILPFAWVVVGVPLAYGISNALQKGIIIFQ